MAAHPDTAGDDGALRASALRLAVASALSDEVVWDWDVWARTVWWSSALERAFGYPAAAVDARQGWWGARLHDEERERVLAGLQQSLDGRAETWSAEYRFRRADGSFAVVQDRARVLRADDGRARRVIGVMADVTPRRDLEAQLARAMRTAAVAGLTGGLVHDLNNLLTVIGGRVHIMRGRAAAEDEALRRDLDVVARTVDRVAALVRQLQAVSGRHALAPRLLDVNAAVTGILPLVARLLGGNAETRLDPGLGRVRADLAHLEHLLLVLAAAAREVIAPEARVTVVTANATAVGLEAGPDPAVMLAIEGTEPGSGAAAPAVAPSADRLGTPASGPGSPDALARELGGRVAVTPGRVALYLPPAEAGALVAEPPAAGGSARHGGTALVVDDDDGVRAAARAALEALGYSVVEARDGDEALAAGAATGPIDLVLVAQVLPRMSGRMLAHRLRAARPDAAVLFLAAHAGPAAAPPGPGMAVLPKPFTPAELARAVQALRDEAR